MGSGQTRHPVYPCLERFCLSYHGEQQRKMNLGAKKRMEMQKRGWAAVVVHSSCRRAAGQAYLSICFPFLRRGHEAWQKVYRYNRVCCAGTLCKQTRHEMWWAGSSVGVMKRRQGWMVVVMDDWKLHKVTRRSQYDHHLQ